MITERSLLLDKTGSRKLRVLLCGALILSQTALLGVVSAATSPPPSTPVNQRRDAQQAPDAVVNRPPPMPPREAIAACAGKQEGERCSFYSRDSRLVGDCGFVGDEWFACRPHPASPPPQAPPPPVASVNWYATLNRYAHGFGSYLVVAMVAAAIAWYGCYQYATVPLRRLRRVTQRLAGGDLSARVGEGLVRRKDEVVAMGRDVDRMAERIEGLVGAQQRLIRDVSHELRSPLARLNVALELARRQAGGEELHAAAFDRIERESDRLNELISQLLMLTKLEDERAMPQRTDFDIASLLGEIAQDVDFEARSQERRVELRGCASLMLNGNRELLRQALENLIRNAVRYTAPGTAVEIALAQNVVDGHGWAAIAIKDQGPGVPEAELNNIFRPFYRVNDARERQSGGAGVGLAISERAVRLHGGSLRASNAPGGGLIMEMDLPLTVEGGF